MSSSSSNKTNRHIRRCSVEACQSCSIRPEDQGVSFHKFPANAEIRQIWFEQCRVNNVINGCVCSRHFRKIDFQDYKGTKYLLKLRAIPSIFDWGVTPYAGQMPTLPKRPTTHMRFSVKPPISKLKSKVRKKSSDNNTTLPVEETKLTISSTEEKSEAPVSTSSKKSRSRSSQKKTPVKEADTVVALPESPVVVAVEPVVDIPVVMDIPVIKTQPINFMPGCRIEAQDFNGAWHSATIMEVDSDEREALIQFDKSIKSKGVADEWIPFDSVRLRSTQPIISLTGRFVEDEKVFARWSDSRKFGATISKVLENDYYTVLFDDGYVKNVRGVHISREKRPLSVYEREQLVLQAKAAKPSPKKQATPVIKQRPQLPPEINEETLVKIDKDGEWCCHWINDIPVGKEGEVQVPSGKILTTIVEDWRLPSGWMKHMYQRGNIAGKWDVILQSPVGRVFRNKVDLKTFLEENGEKYNQDIYDFSIHKRRAKDIGVCTYTEDFKLAATAQQSVMSPSGADSPVTIKSEPAVVTSKITDLLKETIGTDSSQLVSTLGNTSSAIAPADLTAANVLLEAAASEMSSINLDEVYVGSLKVKIVDNLYCCPKEGCLKTFRKENHLQIHIKHYHAELSKMLGVCPNMTDLAALRTTAEDDMVIEQPPRVARKSTSATIVGTPTTIDAATTSTSASLTPTTPVAVRKKPGPKPKPKKDPESLSAQITIIVSTPKENAEPQLDVITPTNKETVKEEPITPRIKRKYTHSPHKKNAVAKKEAKLAAAIALTETTDVPVKEENVAAKMDESAGTAETSDETIISNAATSTPTPTAYSQVFDAFLCDPEALIKSHSVCRKSSGIPLKAGAAQADKPEELDAHPEIVALPPAVTRKNTHRGTKRGRRPAKFGKGHSKKQAAKYPRLSADTSYPDSDETRHSFGVEPPLRNYGHPHFFNQSSGVFDDNTSQTSAHNQVDTNSQNSQYLIEGGEVIKIVSMRQEEIINCICNYFEEDGLMIQCELCLCWQHGICNGIERESQVPDKYICYICKNPVRGRTSKRYIHDQDWLYEGKLPIGKYHMVNPKQVARFNMLKQSHTLTGNLLEMKRYMHSLRVKINIARNKDHPKMYLWAKKWETSPPRSQSSDHQLSGIFPLTSADHIKMEIDDMKDGGNKDNSTANDESSIGKSEQDSLKHSILAGLLSSPEAHGTGGECTSNDYNLSKNLETLANAALSQQAAAGTAKAAVQQQQQQQFVPNIPQPEAAINPVECQKKLLEHIQKQQNAAFARLQKIENEITALEALDEKAELIESPLADNYPKTKQTIQMLLRDLTKMKKIVSINTGYL